MNKSCIFHKCSLFLLPIRNAFGIKKYFNSLSINLYKCKDEIASTKHIQRESVSENLLDRRNLFRFSALRTIMTSCKKFSAEKYEEKTHFGSEHVTMKEKAEKVHGVFENVASKYDLMNDLMSGGIHRLWKDHFVSRLGPTPGIQLLDVAGGTGDITFRVMQHIHNQLREQESLFDSDQDFLVVPEFEGEVGSLNSHVKNPESKVSVLDISQKMLDVGKRRAAPMGYSGIDWVCGDAQNLPFPDQSFDAYTIAFGMRNVPDTEKVLRWRRSSIEGVAGSLQEALNEAYRVLKVGGRFMCLEFSQVQNPLIQRIYDAYSFQLIPVMGQVVAADWKSYQYLVESIRKFPNQETFKAMIVDCGFRRVAYENLTFGVTAIHSGFKI